MSFLAKLLLAVVLVALPACAHESAAAIEIKFSPNIDQEAEQVVVCALNGEVPRKMICLTPQEFGEIMSQETEAPAPTFNQGPVFDL